MRAFWTLAAHLHRDGAVDADEIASHLLKYVGEEPEEVGQYLTALSEGLRAIEGSALGGAQVRLDLDEGDSD